MVKPQRPLGRGLAGRRAMWIIVGCYLLIFVCVTVCIVLTVRGGHGAAEPRRVMDTQPCGLIPEEWEVVTREHCLRSGCQRVVGSPPGPPRDQECVACACEFLELRWTRLLGWPLDGAGSRRFDLPVLQAADPARRVDGEVITEVSLPPTLVVDLEPPQPRRGVLSRYGRYLLAFGTFLLMDGVAVLAVTVARPFKNEDWPWIVLAWALVFCGAAVMILASSAGSSD